MILHFVGQYLNSVMLSLVHLIKECVNNLGIIIIWLQLISNFIYKYQQLKWKREAVCLKMRYSLVDSKTYILTDTRREVNHSPPSRTEVKNLWSYTSAPHIYLDAVDRENFTFIITDMYSAWCCSIEPQNQCRHRLIKFICKLDKNLSTQPLHTPQHVDCLQSAFVSV
jgi:hypothetical protein